ncbi:MULTISPECIES: radical SAM protein [unclassified Neptuniibacter]|uniref:radical SAM protein n=1 Tax=unclassified Neptuniibacter TaxID=2630693 RepID=UPI0026E28CEC|nr:MULTISPECIES: radical SAM protein [unclassified Neptuniibacter]MDO6514357.1 radical SAM protein [Neptuniibacter sp. 2_MG-2023]MDO6594402.1 radical SAM protein [Neptuniibacter sp. 1_MG-2023]
MHLYPPINYIEPVFRPPSEANSLILQVTNGCSWNRCTFCEMYTQPQKKFKPKAQQEIVEDLKRCAQSLAGVRRVFLADGDAMALSFERLKDILLAIKEYLPTVSRVSSYCLPRNLKNKSVEELAELKRLGLSLLYIGAESGNDQILSKIDKGETFQTTVDALHKIKGAAIKSSVMIINGMGGINYTEQHAFDSARLVNETQPDYLATLVLFFHQGEEDFISAFGDDFVMASQRQLIQEMEQFITNLELEQTIFRSDHASNYLVLKGVLNRDKEKLLSMINSALSLDNHIPLRSESSRGL